MNNNEVRVGNIISEHIYLDAKFKTGKDHQVTLSDFAYGFEDYDGIPLTEEWLVKLGFEKNKNVQEYSFDDWKHTLPVYLRNHRNNKERNWQLTL